MNKSCSNCRYFDLDTDALPCTKCSGTTTCGKHYWAPPIETIADPIERLNAGLEYQTYLILEFGRLRGCLNELIETVKERNKI